MKKSMLIAVLLLCSFAHADIFNSIFETITTKHAILTTLVSDGQLWIGYEENTVAYNSGIIMHLAIKPPIPKELQ